MLWLIHDPALVSNEQAVQHAHERGLDLVAHGIPPWMEGTGALRPIHLGGDGYAAVAECDQHAHEVLAMVPHGDVWGTALVAVPCPQPAPAPAAETPPALAQRVLDADPDMQARVAALLDDSSDVPSPAVREALPAA